MQAELQIGTLVIVVLNLVLVAYSYGRLSERVTGLEKQIAFLTEHVFPKTDGS